jgi:hypothetical protein
MPLIYYEHKQTHNVCYVIGINEEKQRYRVRYLGSGYTTWFPFEHFKEKFKRVS